MSPRLRLFIPLLLTLGLGTLLWLGLANNPYRQDEATLGRTLPQWQSENLLDGGLVHTDQLKGEPFVLNVWASCAPTAAPSTRCSPSWPARFPSTASTTETRAKRRVPGLVRQATPIAPCWRTRTASWRWSSASTARPKPIYLPPMAPCSPATRVS